MGLIIIPDNNERILLTQGVPAVFCAVVHDPFVWAEVQLWANLPSDRIWAAFPFVKVQHHHQLILRDIPCGDYEYTARYRFQGDDHWRWYGAPGQNGSIRVVANSELALKPPIRGNNQARLVKQTNGKRLWHSLSSERIKNVGRLRGVHRQITLARQSSSWLTPSAGTGDLQLIIYQDRSSAHLHVIMAVAVESDCWLKFSDSEPETIELHNENPNVPAHLLIASTSSQDISLLLRLCFIYTRKNILPPSHLRRPLTPREVERDDDDDPMLRYLGFCTWNSLGRDNSLEQLSNVLHKFKLSSIPVRYIILDDGWQQYNDKHQLVSMEANQNFSLNLGGSLTKLRELYPDQAQFIGVWHTLFGYWSGISKTFAENQGYGFQEHGSIGLAANPDAFFESYHTFLQSCGVSFLKVDNQGAFQNLNMPDQYVLWDAHRDAMLRSAAKHFSGKVLHCMAQTPWILFRYISEDNVKEPIFRNSDDYFPYEEDSHAWHIYTNALNSILTRELSIVPDWDMFQSIHPFAEYHAISRAISGGPVYISDKPGQHDTDLIQRLVAEERSGGFTLLRCSQAAYPTLDTILGSPVTTEKPIVVTNTNSNGNYRICGYWNPLQNSPMTIAVQIPMDKLLYVCSGLDRGLVVCGPLSINDINTAILRIAPRGCALVSICPVYNLAHGISVSCLGLIDKYNGTMPIIGAYFTENRQTGEIVFTAHLSHRSAGCGFWLGRCEVLGKVLVDGRKCEWTRHEFDVYTVDMTTVPLDIYAEALYTVQLTIALTPHSST